MSHYETILGRKLKEGTINAQDKKSEEWVPCHVILRENGITLNFHPKQKVCDGGGDHDEDQTTECIKIMRFSQPEEVGVTMLPDHARRSRESKLFPFAVYHKKETLVEPMYEEDGEQDYILATSNGREMWEWGAAIKWLGKPPAEEQIPLFYEPSTISNHNRNYENADVLQNTLLKMFTYENVPGKSVSFEDIARLNKGRTFLGSVYYPAGFFPDNDEDEDENEDQDDDQDDKKEEPFMKNDVGEFGLFAYLVLVGSCIHVHEKCFELITSADLYDISSQVKWKGNPIFSMLCEGDYNTSRSYMVKALWRLGYPKLEGYYAGFLDEAFTILLAKPGHLYGCHSPTGQAVHPDDQKLCRLLRDNGDGSTNNKELTNQLIEASKSGLTEFMGENRRQITSIHIPESIKEWGYTCLKKLDLSHNGIFEIPDELYDFTSLSHLNLSQNCIFGLSHKLGNLTNLEKLDIYCNLITELPDSIEKLEGINDFRCHRNPLTKPPSAVWARGIGHVRSFFKDMRESGTEVNVDLRVLVLGLSEAGKTSLVNGLVNPAGKALTRIGDRTVGIEKRIWKLERGEDEPVNLLTYDFAGQEEYYITHHLFLGNRALYILAFDLSKYESAENKSEIIDQQILLWWESIQNRVCDVKSNDSKTPKVIIVGTHADMVIDDAQIVANDVHKYLTEHLQLRMKTIMDRIRELEKELRKIDPRKMEENEAEAEEELKCLKRGKRTRSASDNDDAKRAKYDKLPTDIKMKILTMKNEVDKLWHLKECTIVLPNEIHAISSKTMLNFDSLREQIASSLTEISPSGKYFPQLDEQLPRSWFQVRKFVRDQSTRKGRECMKLSQYIKLLTDELGIDESVVRRSSKFCHDLDDILFFDNEGLVFLRPSFLIDVFKLIIRHDHQESTYFTEEMLENGISEDQFNAAKKSLLQKGELEEWFLDLLWSRLDDDIGMELNMKNNLIQLLETFDIATSIQSKGHSKLLIPEFQHQFIKHSNWSEQKDDGQFEIRRWICVDQNIPRGVLKRLQVRILKHIFKRNSDSTTFNLSQDEFHILEQDGSSVYCKCEKGDGKYHGFEDSEGIHVCIRGYDEKRISSLFTKVLRCIDSTLEDFPGLIFDHYEMSIAKKGFAFTKLEGREAKYNVMTNNKPGVSSSG